MLQRKPRPQDRSIVGLLDVGSFKVACLIAEIAWQGEGQDQDGPSARLLGLGHHRSRGVKAGVVVSIDETEAAIRGALGQAERMAGLRLEAVMLGVACGRLKSSNFRVQARIPGSQVENDDVQRVLAAAEAHVEREGRSLVQLTPNGFQLDESADVADPRGMAGRRLGLNVNAVTADDAPLRNLLAAVERSAIQVAGILAAPYASALATTTEAERRDGVVCVDMGAGISTLAAFAGGRLVLSDVILLGGGLLTYDIARTLSTPLTEAERIKVLYGTIATAQSDERELIPYTLVGEDGQEPAEVSRAGLATIVEPRVAMLLRQIEERLAASGIADRIGGRMVLTGGASGLGGLGPYAARQTGRAVRIGRAHCPGVPQNVCDLPFASIIGLLAASMSPRPLMQAYRDRNQLAPGYLGRIRDWVQGF